MLGGPERTSPGGSPASARSRSKRDPDLRGIVVRRAPTCSGSRNWGPGDADVARPPGDLGLLRRWARRAASTCGGGGGVCDAFGECG